MKRFLLTMGAGLMALSMASPSLAADLSRPVYKAPMYVAPFSWTGFYVGINGGYGFGKSSWTNVGGTSGDFDVKGPLVGGTLGYNLQTGAFVFGLEADADASWIKGSTTSAPVGCGGAGCETRNRYLATGRGRIGYAWDRFLPYITGGAAFGDIKATNPAGGSVTKSKLGYVLGAGVEYAFLGPWSAKIEYNYVDLGKVTCGVGTCIADTDVKFKANIIKAGVNYRF
jgi:outer membrane immunogenic protein